MNGKYVIVRGDRSGVFAGVLVAQDGRTVELKDLTRNAYGGSVIRNLEKAYAAGV